MAAKLSSVAVERVKEVDSQIWKQKDGKEYVGYIAFVFVTSD